jgi:hypothetical protein
METHDINEGDADMNGFTFYTDPGHGWLAITPEQSIDAGVDPDRYSPCSYRLLPCPFAPSGLLLLEEDCDAGLFLRAAGIPSLDSTGTREVYGNPVRFPFPNRRGYVNLRDLPRLPGSRFVSPFARRVI